MPDPGLTPDLALRYLAELSTDIRASAVIGPDGEPVACSLEGLAAERMAAGVRDLLERTDALPLLPGAPEGDGPQQVEVALRAARVFAVRENGWTVAVVAGRFALVSLMFFDIRSVMADMQLGAAA